MSGPGDGEPLRRRIERALAALAGSGLDSGRFTVIVDPAGARARPDSAMTAVLAVGTGGLRPLLDALGPDRRVAWVADPGADPDLGGRVDDEVMLGQVVGTAAELASTSASGVLEGAGWLVVAAGVPAEVTDAVLRAALEAAIGSGASPSRAAKQVAGDYGVPKRRVYELAVSTGG